MRALVLTLTAGAFAASSAAAEPLIFHTAHFDDDTVVNLGLVSNRMTELPGFDYDVLISLSKTAATSGAAYRDPGKHRALVRCNDPAKVSVGGVDYQIPTSGAGGGDWKDDLWKAVCEFPLS